MTLQVQKVEIEETVPGLDLGPVARIIELVWARWNRASSRRAVRVLSEALGLIADRVEREPVRKAHALELRRREKLERSRVRMLRDGEDDPALTGADLKVLKSADQLQATAAEVRPVKGKPAARIIGQAARMRTGVAAGVVARGEARRAALRLAQTVELDAAREGLATDEVIAATRGVKHKRLRTRDGLVLLFERGAYAPRNDQGEVRTDLPARIEAQRLLSAGERYRDRYEVAQASLKSCLDVADGVKRSPTLAVQAKAAHRRAALANQVRQLEIAVVTQAGELALEALRRVAGEARTINSISTSGHRREQLTAALVAALKVVASILDRTG